MNKPLKLIPIGNSTGAIFPKDLLQQLGVGVKSRVVDALQSPLHGQGWRSVVKRKRDPELV